MRNIAVISCIAIVLGACSGSESPAADAPIVAGTDSPDRDLADHLEAMIQAVRTTPGSALMRGRLGMAYDVNGFQTEALATYAQAETLDPGDFRWPYFSAHLLAANDEHAKALDVLARALAIDADYASAWLWQGTWLLELDRTAEAMIAFERAFDLGVRDAATFGRARVMATQGDYAEAVELLEPLARLSDNPQVHRTLGEALRGQGRTEEARTAMIRGRNAGPVSWEDPRRDQRSAHVRGHASYQLAQSLSSAGRISEALTILERLQGHHPETHCGRDEDFFLACNLMNSCSIAYDRDGDPERALATVQRGLALNADFAPFHLTIANLYRQQRDLDLALDHVDRALELNPARGYAHEQRGRLLFGMGRHADAKAAFESALGLEPEKRTTLFYLGLAEFELGNWTLAVEKFERAVQLEPGFALGHALLARSLAEAGRIDEARQAQRNAREHGAGAEELRLTEQRLRELEAIEG
ncbi:MAG: tetratricopeptide repeat protein [Gammaproteobacteria bacterium]|nr:tetratricopeptide repeat protein [Gammaproteobacteria bacterium]